MTNNCQVGNGVDISGWIKGKHNVVEIDFPVHECKINLRISGNSNKVLIRRPFAIKNLTIIIGNHVSAHDAKLSIAPGFSVEGGCNFLLYNSGNSLNIGESFMFSNTITVRCGDSPHLIFNKIRVNI